MTERRVAWWTAAAALWTFVTWGNRIGLLSGDEAAEPWTWIRVGGSLLFGVALAAVAASLFRGRPYSRWMANALIGFAVLTVVIWIRSSVSTLSGEEGVAFKLVHVVLALISIWLGMVLFGAGIKRLRKGVSGN